MKRCFYIFSTLFLSFIFINNINALSASANIKCNQLSYNGETTCNVYLNVDEGKLQNISVDALDVVSGADIVSINGEYTNVLANDSVVSNGDKIGYFKVKSSGYGSAKVSISINAKDESGNNVSVKAGTYSFNILSPVATLSSITINSSLISGFNSNTYKYNISDINEESITLGAVPTVSGTTVSGIGNKKLSCGANSVNINTVSTDKSKKLTYTLNINRVCDDNVSLKGITLSSGSLMPAFNADTLEYKVSVDTNTEKISINPLKDDKQTVTGAVNDAKLAFGDNSFQIKVTSQSGKTKIYKIIVNRADDRSNNALLSSLTIDNGKLNFDKNIFVYDVRVLNEIDTINVVAASEDTKAKVDLETPKKLTVGDNKVVVKVTAENGSTQEYIINIKRLEEGEVLGDNPNAANIIITGYNINFNPTVTSYNLKLDNKTKKLNISVIMQEEGATYQINGNNDLKDGDIITINTTSMDGTQNTYKIIIEKSHMMLYILIIAIVLLIGSIVAIVIVVLKKKNKNPRIKKEKNIKQEQVENIEAISNQEASEIQEINNKINTLKEEQEVLKEKEEQRQNIFDKYRKENKGLMDLDQLRELDPTQNGQTAYGNRGHSEEYDRIEITEDQTKQCSKCGHRINFSSEVCPYCGKEFQ